MSWRLEKSALSRSGTISVNCSSTGTTNACVMRCFAIICTISTGLISRTMTVVAPIAWPAVAHPPPPMWNSGIAAMFTVSGPKPQIWRANGSSAKKLSFVSITPLGRPVVPLE